MSRFAWMVVAACMIVACSCNQQKTETSSAEDDNPVPAEYSPMAGQNIAVGGDAHATVISVGDFDANTKSLAGLVAIEGRVSETNADMHAFILVDCSNKAGCQSSCCPQASVPVRLTAGGYTGDLPQAGEAVVVIGDLTVTETGYKLDVLETRRGSETLLKMARTEI